MSNNSVLLFWGKYISKTIAYGVKGSSVRRYVRYAETYIKANSGISLSLHTAGHVERYLNTKGRINRLEDWQFK